MDINKIMELANNFNIVELGAMLAGRDDFMVVTKTGHIDGASKGVPSTTGEYDTVRHGRLYNFRLGSDLGETFIADGKTWQVIAKTILRGNASQPSKLIFVALATDENDELDRSAVAILEEASKMLFSHPASQAEFVRKAVTLAHEMREQRKEWNRQVRYRNWQEV
jgi:hypothetical protein